MGNLVGPLLQYWWESGREKGIPSIRGGVYQSRVNIRIVFGSELAEGFPFDGMIR